MAITKIYGFQQFHDVQDVVYQDLTVFGKLPFHINYFRIKDGGFKFTTFQERVWLRSHPGAYSYSGSNDGIQNTLATRSSSFNFPLTTVYGDYLTDPSSNRFYMGLRFWFPTTGISRPETPITLQAFGGDQYTNGRGVTILDLSECPNVADVVFYAEVELDFDLMIAKRWIDGVRLTDVALPSGYGKAEAPNLHWHIARKLYDYNNWGLSDDAYNYFGVNDLYFVADTEHLVDGTPSRRLGPVTVDALVPEVVELPGDWTAPTGTDPVALVTDTPTNPDMRGVPSLTSDPTGTPATVRFKQPETKEGEILFAEVEIYGWRQYGDTVEMNTQVIQGTGQTDVLTSELEPERIKTGANAIRPAQLHKPLDGSEVWDEAKLGALELKVFTTKPST